MGIQPLVGQGLLIRGYSITLRHITIGKTDTCDQPDAEIIHNTHKRQTSMPPAGFKPTISKPAAANPPLKPRGRWDRLNPSNTQSYYTEYN